MPFIYPPCKFCGKRVASVREAPDVRDEKGKAVRLCWQCWANSKPTKEEKAD